MPLTDDQLKRLELIKAELEQLTQTRMALIEPVKQKLIAERQAAASSAASGNAVIDKSETGNPAAFSPPVATATWEFDGDLKDEQGRFELTAHGEAKVVDGALVLDASSLCDHLATAHEDFGKDLEVWVQLDKLDQGGGAPSSWKLPTWDCLMRLATRSKNPRMDAGSNGFARTKSFQEPTVEENAHQRFVHFAIVYQADGLIRAYRDGQVYGTAYNPGPLQTYEAKTARLLFGLRHAPVGGNRMLPVASSGPSFTIAHDR